MSYIIIKGSPYVRGGSSSKDDWSRSKDELHRRRKELESDLRQTIFSKDKMQMRDCKDEIDENKRTAEYDIWKATKDKTGKTNEDKLREFSEINREFKKRGEEGNLHNADQLREKKAIKYN